jgi:hypothetical protein
MQTAPDDAPRTGNGLRADDDTPRSLDIELDPPIEFNGKTYSTLHLEEPTGRMIERAESELATTANIHTLRKYQFAIVSLASGVPRGAIEQMRISQIEDAALFLARFTGGGRATGET